MTNNTAARLLAAVAVALVIGLGVSTVYRSGPHQMFGRTFGSKVHRTDFTVYQEAGRAVLEGANIYDAPSRRGWFYQYLPVGAVAMAPFALLNVFWASLLWYLLSVAAVVHAVRISVRLARQHFPEHKLPDHWVAALVVLLLAWPTMSGLARGQASLLISYLAIAVIWFYTQRRDWLAGLCLAGSIVLKVFPTLLLVYFVAKRRWLMAAATCVWLFVLLIAAPSAVFGLRGNYDLLRQWVTAVAMPANNPDKATTDIRFEQMINPRIHRNQSVQAVVIRWIAGRDKPDAVPAREPLARRVALGVNLVLFAASAWACRRGMAAPDERRTLMQLCLVSMLMLFLSPVSWVHNYTLLILPLAVALAASFRIVLIVFAAGSVLALTVPVCHALGAFLAGAMAVWAAFTWRTE